MDEQIMVRIRDAGISFKGYSLSGVSLDIPRGYITGITGPNGAGKTTLIKMMMGLYPRMAGTIMTDGADVVRQREKMLEMTGFVSEEREFFMEFNAFENEDMYRPFYPGWDKEKYREYIGLMKIPSGTGLKNLSKGNYIKYQLAFELAHKPSLLILDEPTSGLDPVFRMDFLKLLQELIAQEEMTVIMSTNITDDLDKIADYIIRFGNGSCDIEEAGYEKR